MTTNPQFLIRKASGESEPFDIPKLIRSLQKAGADTQKAESIANDISSLLAKFIKSVDFPLRWHKFWKDTPLHTKWM